MYEPECVDARTLDDRDDVILIRVDFCYPGCAVVRRQPCGVYDRIRQWRRRGVVPVADSTGTHFHNMFAAHPVASFSTLNSHAAFGL